MKFEILSGIIESDNTLDLTKRSLTTSWSDSQDDSFRELLLVSFIDGFDVFVTDIF